MSEVAVRIASLDNVLELLDILTNTSESPLPETGLAVTHEESLLIVQVAACGDMVMCNSNAVLVDMIASAVALVSPDRVARDSSVVDKAVSTAC